MTTPVNILLVDDEPRNLEVLESILESDDYRLVRAQTADAALLELVQAEFACIVLDIRMPGMSGFELARIIKTRKRSQHIPIIFLTAYFQEDQYVLQGYGVGAVDYLTKPTNPEVLRSKVGVFVELFRTTRALTSANNALQQRTAELAQINKELESQIQERRQLEALVLKISEREQQRIGQDLHDGLCQQLTGIKFRSGLLEQKLTKCGAAEAADAHVIETLLSQAVEQARGQARGLNPVRLEADGLMSALQELADSVAHLFGIECVCDSPNPVLLHDHAVAVHLYRIAQEAITNAVRHGEASKVRLQLAERNGYIQLGIQDNGIGFSSTPQQNGGMGLHIMQYRARTISAGLHVQPVEPGGTLVTCSLPRPQLQPATQE
jgi:signal transduction histidine kinase